jgi:hypothetical protein
MRRSASGKYLIVKAWKVVDPVLQAAHKSGERKLRGLRLGDVVKTQAREITNAI